MGGMNVADLKKGLDDSSGASVLTIYCRKPPDYAVYRTSERVVVHYADDAKLSLVQRRTIARLNPLRGEINGLIDGWRRPKWFRKSTERAEQFDRRVADVLIVCLEGDPKGAEGLLTGIKQEVLNQRVSAARFSYLTFALGAVVASFIIIVVSTRCWSFPPAMIDLWRAAAAGAVGAFFSLALSLHSRTVLPDLFLLANAMDATLRILIGVIAATILVCLIRTGAVSIEIGGASPCNTENAWAYVMLAGFLAGFSERMVADLLGQGAGKVTLSSAPPPAPKPEAPEPVAPSAASVAAAPAPELAVEEEEPDAHKGVDHCVSDVELTDDELTRDEDLPPASGGVAPPEKTS